MTNLIINSGNTRIKATLLAGEKLVEEQVFEVTNSLINYCKSAHFDYFFMSFVKWSQPKLQELFPFRFTLLSLKAKLPITNASGTPANLGLDRVAGIFGAWAMRDHDPTLAIDLGTCVTFDLDESNRYLGGANSPRLGMPAGAIHEQTSRLPLVDLKNKPAELIGDNTITCMQIGIWRRIEFELRGQIEAFTKKFPEIEVFVSGGDAQSFDSLAKDLIFVVPNLILYGLNSILNHNVE